MGVLVDKVKGKHPRLGLILDIITRFGFYIGMIILFVYIRAQFDILISECPCLLYNTTNTSLNFSGNMTNVTEFLKSINQTG